VAPDRLLKHGSSTAIGEALCRKRLDDLLRTDTPRARIEIAKHLDGDLTITPRPAMAGERVVIVSGRVKANSLLGGQEAVCLTLVAGAGSEPATFGYECEGGHEHHAGCVIRARLLARSETTPMTTAPMPRATR
jgi:hypothetical protein